MNIDSFLKNHNKPVIVILGPTASGKTKFSLDLAEKYNGVIVSADSRQIYTYMDIGTAKIMPEEQRNIEHFMINIVNPDKDYSVSEYQKEVYKIFDQELLKNKVPILVGGTGLYIDAVMNNFQIPPHIEDTKLREKLEKEFDEKGGEYLYKQLQEKDPLGAEKVHPNNKHHLIRALEVVLTTGKSKFALAEKGESPYDFYIIGIDVPREDLYERINKRVFEMFDMGLVEETQKLLDMGYAKDLPSMTSIGYREVIQMIDGEISKEEAIETIQQKTRNYAKRQMTWFRKNKDIHWIEV